ncbi:Ig-like domain-containing protein [Pseudomonas sp. TWP3-1]|uniref:Ig-like domain-containing protein n=1 Tax=Pseudomonas sp. TWP3-1 TaxID=2804631 RepID=UPI003CECB255
MTTKQPFTKAGLDKINYESRQIKMDLFAKQRSVALFEAGGLQKILPPFIPGSVPLTYEQATWGVNADETDGPGNGWLCLCAAYLQQETNDTIQLFKGKCLKPGEAADPLDPGTLIDTFLVPQNHNNEDTSGNIPSVAVQHTCLSYWWYLVMRTSGNTQDESERIAMLFIRTFPDSLNPTGDTSVRKAMGAPGFPAVIDKKMLAAGFINFIIPAWSIMFDQDKIVLDLDGVKYEFEIKLAHIGKDVTVPVPSAVLESIGASAPFLVRYSITDLVGNTSLPSAVGAGELIPEISLLDAATVRNTLDDTLELDALDHKPMQVDIYAPRAEVVAGDKFELTISDHASGFSEIYGPFSYRVGVNTVEIPYEVVSQLAPTTINLKYTRIRPAPGLPASTPSYSYAPSLRAHSYLAPPPVAFEAQGGVLSSELKETLVCCGPDVKGMKLADEVRLTCKSTSAGGTVRLQDYKRYVTESMEVPGIGFSVPFSYETGHFSTFPDGLVELFYVVTGDGHAEPIKSKVLHLRIAPATHQLEVIEVAKVIGNVLDPANTPFGTPAKCLAAAHTKIGDKVYIELWKNDSDPDKTGELMHVDSLPITPANVAKDVEFRLEHELIEGLLNNVIRIYWFIKRFRSAPLTAPPRELRIGHLVLALGPPKLQEASGNNIDPEKTHKSATLEVIYEGMHPTHKVTAHVIGRPGFGSPLIASKQGDARGKLLFDVPPPAFSANMGTFMSFHYVVAQPGINDQTSSSAKHKVQTVDKPELKFPSVTIQEAQGNVVDFNKFTGDAHWRLIPYLFMAIGTRMRIAFSGLDKNGKELVFMAFDGQINANHVKSGLSGTIPRPKLLEFMSGSALNSMAIANFSDKGGADTLFPISTLTIITLVLAKPQITQLIDNQPPRTGQVPNGGGCDDTTPEVVGTATPKTIIDFFIGGAFHRAVTVDANGIWRTTLNLGYGTYNFTAQTQDGLKVSNTWTVRIGADLSIGGNAHVNLSAYFVFPGRPPRVHPPGAIIYRPPSGGIGPYTITSSNPAVAVVINNQGSIAAVGNGSAQITVTDGSGQSASFIITVTGVTYVRWWSSVNWHVHLQGSWVPYCLQYWEVQALWNLYAPGGDVPTQLGIPGGNYWTATNHPINHHAYAFMMGSGTVYIDTVGARNYPTIGR